MPLAPNMQDPQENFFKPLQFFAKPAIPTSVISRHPRSFRRVRLGHRNEIRISPSSFILTDLRSHRSASLVTESNRAKIDGIRGRRSDWAFRARRWRLSPSTSNHRRDTREQRFRSPELRNWKTIAKHSSGISDV